MGFPHVMVIDPALRRAEIDAYNHMLTLSPLPVTYHVPAIFGFESFGAERDEDLRAIVVLGSGASVNDRYPWQERLEEWLRPRLARGVPTLAICYGHQMLAHMYGGRVGWVFPDGSKHLGLREIALASELPAHAPAPWRGRKGRVVVSHMEHVKEPPKGFLPIASSPAHAYEALAHESLPIYSFQSHPEAAPATAKAFGVELAAPAQDLAFGHDLVRDFLAALAR